MHLTWPGLALLLMLASSCSNTRYLQEGEVLYKDSRVTWPHDAPDGKLQEEQHDLAGDLLRFEKQKANQKIFGILAFKLWFYNVLTQSEEGFLKAWINNGRGIGPLKDLLRELLYPPNSQDLRDWFVENLGEPPVLYDSTLAESAAAGMEVYLHDNGFFNAKVDPEHQIRRKKGTANYVVESGSRYMLRNIVAEAKDTFMLRLITKPQKDSILKSGEPYRLSDLKAERVRIRDTLLNNGYFTFDRNFVEFELDSMIGNQQLDVYVRILPPEEDTAHHRYRIGEVYCYPDFQMASLLPDVVPDTVYRRKIHLISYDLKFRVSTLLNPIFINPGSWYDASAHTLTLRKFTELGAFKFVSITYRKPEGDSTQLDPYLLDAYIRLMPSLKQQWSVELNANTNFNSLIGSDLDFNYRNRNLFHNADLFTLNLSSGLETQVGEGESFIRNVDFTGTANLDIPKFVVPFKIKRSRRYNPVTSYAARYSYVQRIEFYTLHSTSVSVAYSWRRNPVIAHRLSPVDVSLVRPTEISDAFRAILNDNLLLTQSFQQQIIPAGNYTFLYNQPSLNGSRNGLYFRGGLEFAGNVVNAVASLAGGGDTINNISGIPLAQYGRLQTDFRYYFNRSDQDVWVFRLATGVGLPYGNSAALPFVKQFFAGGPSSVRAWRVRRLGPGSFEALDDGEQNVFIDQTGDLSLEANVEYRFPIYNLVKGAFFVDAGNIWLLKEDVTRPGGKISPDFYQDIALGTGVGLRLDFSFFVFRADFGLRVRDPAVAGSRAWLWTHPEDYLNDFSRNTEFNIAIGYPF
ncbi:MAG: BamA/TamA family outer membrane protein [Bacteroidetes bacterium]|nr:BamA/TamA family outer membrane protein [Bacteroidota bacterium]